MKTVVSRRKYLILIIFLTNLFSMRPCSAYISNKNHWEIFKIEEPASKVDWKFFLDSDQNWRRNLWLLHRKKGKTLDDWSWTWRLGWLQVCHNDFSKWCSKIMVQALKDKAMVVRSKAATLWGKRFLGTQNKKAGEALAKVYFIKENDRNGKPLFVKMRILAALKNIGGDQNIKIGRNLASKHQITYKYWKNQ